MKILTKCPECGSKLYNNSQRNLQVCPVCGYWTVYGTARLDSIMIYA